MNHVKCSNSLTLKWNLSGKNRRTDGRTEGQTVKRMTLVSSFPSASRYVRCRLVNLEITTLFHMMDFICFANKILFTPIEGQYFSTNIIVCRQILTTFCRHCFRTMFIHHSKINYLDTSIEHDMTFCLSKFHLPWKSRSHLWAKTLLSRKDLTQPPSWITPLVRRLVTILDPGSASMTVNKTNNMKVLRQVPVMRRFSQSARNPTIRMLN